MTKSTLEKYRLWLTDNTKLKGKSLNDLFSRSKRINKLIKINANTTDEQIHMQIVEHKSFASKKNWTISQHKKAAKMYRNFLAEG